MRVLIAVPHYYGPPAGSGDARWHGSTAADPRDRVAALSAAVAALHQLYGPDQHVIDIASREAPPANARIKGSVHVVVCTTGGRHLLNALPLPAGALEHRPTDAEPRLLGYECHAALRDGLGRYDYYGYIEDDLVARDPWMFRKLAWFNGLVGDDALLQPNRYEVGPLGLSHKAYVDGDLPAATTSAFQDVTDRPVLEAVVMGTAVTLRRALNPHSGCFFLNARQMAAWAARGDFLDRSSAFVGPLESAATLGVTRAFRVYKPAPDCASFLEIEHSGTELIGQLRRRAPSA